MRLVGNEVRAAMARDLGLSKDWAARIIRHVGNYGEVYERNVVAAGPLQAGSTSQQQRMVVCSLVRP
jgi:general L-amino acid transport system substrate-binding protein